MSDKFENAMKAIKESNVQWPGLEIMVDFCLAGDSP